MFALKPVSTLTCPVCGHQASETMPTDSCQYFYECTGCKTVSKAGDCCVFCSYGDMPCPSIQEARASGLRASCCSRWQICSNRTTAGWDRRSPVHEPRAPRGFEKSPRQPSPASRPIA